MRSGFRWTAAAVGCCLLLLRAAAAPAQQASEPRYHLATLLTIGDDAEEAYTFHRISDIAVSADGGIYVLDGGDHAVKAYDAAGRFLRRFGKRGSGPGEFTQPVDLRVDSLVTVFDAGQHRLAAFSLAGEHRRTRRLAAPEGVALSTQHLLRGGISIGTTPARHSLGSPAHDPRQAVLLIGPDGTVADTLIAYHSGATLWHPVNEQIPWGIARSDFGPAGAWAVLGDSMVVVADGYGGEVRWYAAAGGRLQRIRASRLPNVGRAITDADLREVERRFREETRQRVGRLALEPPPRWSAATRAVIADDGSLWIQNGNDPDRSSIWSVFDPRGRFVHRIRLPAGFALRFVRGDRLYGIARTELDVDHVRVYRLSQR